MFNCRAVSLPRNSAEAIARISFNVAYFRVKYLMIVLSFLFLSLVWHPKSFKVFVFMTATWPLLRFIGFRSTMLTVAWSALTLMMLYWKGAAVSAAVALLDGTVIVVVHAVVMKTNDAVNTRSTTSTSTRTWRRLYFS
ncbi:hypothetical protein LWI28_023881 [Acer negundo]|uniref:PRA1 family protein n=1 Tax=Acer negundo TaxID=4023 RepID=A0AAD5NKA4_ACENE|nr:hypothetical protein LWI28_023881 [Acer negundo]KAK4837158.1 hypothetical protein QYF36_003240 [Acer negundo]